MYLKLYLFLILTAFLSVSLPSVHHGQSIPWTVLDSLGLTKEKTTQMTSVLHPVTQQPVLLYKNNEGKADVLSYRPDKWEQVGRKSFSTGEIDEPILTIDRNGQLFAVFSLLVKGIKSHTEVQQYDSVVGDWVRWDSIPAVLTKYSIVFDSGNQPILAGYDQRINTALVFRHSTGNWKIDSSAKFVANSAIATDLLIDKYDHLYIGTTVYHPTENKFYLQKFHGNKWTRLDSIPFSQGGNSIDVALWKDTVYIAFADFRTKEIIAVKYNGTAFENIGSVTSVEASEGGMLFLDISTSGTPYLVYVDLYYKKTINILNYDKEWTVIHVQPSNQLQKFNTDFYLDNMGSIYLSYPSGGAPLVRKYMPVITSTHSPVMLSGFCYSYRTEEGTIVFDERIAQIILTRADGKREIHSGNTISVKESGLFFLEVYNEDKVCRTKVVSGN